ncbi:Endonuclease/Exonuclease/phosphatase family protein [Rubripirellula lacrimiformis]|uniref:Endonuclease/Exonuclease/phosphatase family protein n=2 Tax=Rubripirellula lacrimiformis TaxID=1930273 RepID=A0A517NBI8_9BACT|nr:Endonuclease/Exonuclease/phosphatase family protein [Rubripirellula lacrimiformis]
MLLLVAVVTAAAPYNWIANLLAELRLQQCIAILIVAALTVLRRQWIVLTILLMTLSMHAPAIFSGIGLSSASARSSGPSNRAVRDAAPWTITVVNALISNQRHGEVIAEILQSDPDVFVVIELSHELSDKISAHTEHCYPHRMTRPISDHAFGIGIFSKHPISHSEIFSFAHEIDSIAATIDIDGRKCRVYATHPLPPVSEFNFNQRNDHLTRLARKILTDRKTSPGLPTVVVGDMNATPWAPALSQFSNTTRLRLANVGLDWTPTHYSGPSWFPFGIMIDHVLISPTLTCLSKTVGKNVGSDHRSVTCTLGW